MSRWQTAITRAKQFDPRSVPGLALWLDGADTSTLYTTDAGPVTAVTAPTDISGCALWLDASDASSITATGGLVDQWSDKSGNGRHFTGTGAARPTTGTRSQNGRNVLDFTGAQTLLGNEASKSIARNVGAITVLMAVAIDDAAANRQLLVISRSGSANQSRCGIASVPGAIRLYGRRTDADAVVILQATATPTSNRLFTGQVVYSSSDAYLYIDGLLSASSTSYLTDGSTSDTNSDSVSIGSGPTGDEPLDGWIAEVIVYPSALSMTDRARVEAYLALKWGISGVHAQATATSDPVGQWRDKSGNNRHATQATGANRPTVSGTTLNGRRQLSFVSQHLRGPESSWNGSATIYWAGRTGQSASGAFVFHDGEADQPSAFHAGWLNAQGVGAYGNGWNSGNAPRAESPNNWRLSNVVAGVTLSSSEAIARVNGATVNTTAALTGTLSQSTSAQPFIGRDAGNVWNNLNGTIAELLIFQPALTAAQRLAVERYLGSKWSITLAPQVSNTDAQSWINRVYANGGTVSASTASAVNTLCNSIDAAGIRDRFYRMGIFAGSNLAASLVPLYRGPSLGGTQFGNATDTNFNFVSGDYQETGAGGGLIGTGNNGVGVGNSKHLRTGLQQQTLATSNLHIAAYMFGLNTTSATQQGFIGIRNNTAPANRWWLEYRQTAVNAELAGNGVGFGTLTTPLGNALISVSRESSTLLRQYVNGSQFGSDISTDVTSSLASRANDWYVFAYNIDGAPGGYCTFRMGGYSIGLSLTPAQTAAYNAAMQAFQSALGRT